MCDENTLDFVNELQAYMVRVIELEAENERLRPEARGGGSGFWFEGKGAMTVDDKALVERLATAIKKSIGKQFNATPIHPNPSVEDWTASGGVLDLKQVAQALLPIISDRIEAQAAEIERLRAEAQAQFDRGYYDGSTRQPTQSDAVIKLLETMRERCPHPCRSEKAELGCDCDAARQAAVILRQPTQSDALREALEAAPLIGHTESVYDFMERQEKWLKGPYRAAMQEQSK